MLDIPGGSFLIGSPEDEAERNGTSLLWSNQTKTAIKKLKFTSCTDRNIDYSTTTPKGEKINTGCANN